MNWRMGATSWSVVAGAFVALVPSAGLAFEGPELEKGSGAPPAIFDELGPIWVCFDGNDPPDQGELAFIHLINEVQALVYNLAGRWPGTQGDPIALDWSFMPDGVLIPQSGNDEPPQGSLASNLFATLDGQFPSRAAWVSRFQQSFDRWQGLTGITFTRITSGGNDWDDGMPWGTPGDGVNRGDIRIGGRCIDGTGGVDCAGGTPIRGNILAYNQFPGSGGDMVLDTADTFFTGGTQTFLRNLVMHELGHGVGLFHVCPSNQTKLMEPIITVAFDGPRHDDIRGAQVHYGDPFEEDNASGTATDLGAITASTPIELATGFPAPRVAFGSIHSIDENGEQDFFRFTISQAEQLDLTVTPVGLTYDSSTQQADGDCNSGNLVDSESAADLAFQIIGTDGSSVLVTVDGQPAGGTESILDFNLAAAGDYFIRVYEVDAPTASQLYNMELCVNEAPIALCMPFAEEADGACCATVNVADIDGGSFDPDGAADVDAIAITAVDGVPVGQAQSVAVCDDGTLSPHTVTLTIIDLSGVVDSCNATVTIIDLTSPEPTCPSDATVTCGDPVDPSHTGTAVAVDNCDPDPLVDFHDVEVLAPCPADPVMFTINRTWTATDDSGNAGSCLQTVSVLKVEAELDIKPTSCPNPLNRTSNGYLPVGLLGTADFDVTTVNISSLRISRGDCVGGTVAPHEGPPGPHTVLSDVGTPLPGDPCDCHGLGGDGIPDLSMKFSTPEVVAALQLDALPEGTVVELVVTGSMADGCEFAARDCVVLVPPGGGNPTSARRQRSRQAGFAGDPESRKPI